MPANHLKIAILSVHSCPVGNLGAKDTGGMSVYIRELARELGQRGHTVDIYTRVHDPRDRQIYELNENVRLIHLRAGEIEEIHKLAVYPYLAEFAGHLENFRKQNGLHYDLIFSHYWLSGLVGQYLQQWWHTPHLTIFHTLGAVKNTFGIGEDEPELRLEMEREVAQNCDRIIATTEKEKEDIGQHYGVSPEKISVIPCGVNLELFRPIGKKLARQHIGSTDGKLLLFVGRIEPLKGIEQLLQAMSYLTSHPRPGLLIIGGDKNSHDELAGLQKLCRRLQIQDSVNFLGLIKHEEMPYFYSAVDACVIPSYYESFGLVGLESLACGTPVIATDVGNLKNIIQPGKTGYVIADNAPRTLAGKIDLLLSVPGPEADTLSIRESVREFAWSNIAEAMLRQCHLVLADLAPALL